MKILIIDDTEDSRYVLKEILGTDFEYIEVPSGEEGIRVLRTNPDIDIIFLDFIMPRMNGEETYKIIRLTKTTIPIVIVSGLAIKDVDINSGDKNLYILHKPFRLVELLEVVSNIISNGSPPELTYV
jgi:CheY-like chemotaxis protein